MNKINLSFMFIATALLSMSTMGCNGNKNKSVDSSEEVHEHTLGAYQHDDHDHWKICTVCGEIVGKETHRGGQNTCLKKAVCDICGAEYGTIGDHNYGPWTFVPGNAYHSHECTFCHNVENENHKFNKRVIDPTYLVGAYDSSCTGSNTYYLSCECGAFAENPENTFVVDNHHDFTEETILPLDANLISPATCVDSAVYGKVCEHCHTEFSLTDTFEYGAPKGHTYDVHEEVLTFATYHKAYAYCADCNTYFIDEREPGALEPNYRVATADEIFDDTQRQYGREGFGTLENPYIITSETDLIAFRTAVNSGDSFSGKFFVMNGDITLTENKEFGDCIGKDDSHPFSGTLDGNNHTITNFYKTKALDGSDAKDAVALFSRITGGTVKNLKLANVTAFATGQRVAGLVARAYSATIENVEIVSGTITGGKQTGGIAGVSIGITTIKNCINRAHIISNGTSNGGILGHQYSSTLTIENCANYGQITTNASGASGLGTGGILGNTNTGDIASTLPGETTPSALIKNNVNHGAINSNGEATGGIVGQVGNKNGGTGTFTITGNTNNGNVSGKSNGTGGVLGSSGTPTTFTLIITDCTNNGSITGSAYNGGIAGLPRKNTAASTIQNCTNNGNVTGNTYVGGIVGAARVNVLTCRILNTVSLKVGSTTTVVTSLNAVGGGSSTAGYLAATQETNGSGSKSTITGEIYSA